MSKTDSRNLKIVGADDLSLKLQVMPNGCVEICIDFVEWDADKGRQQRLDEADPLDAIAVFLGTMKQFGKNNRASDDLLWRN
jgi:hypothetical protein